MNLDTLARIHAEQARDTVTGAEVPPLDRTITGHRRSWFVGALVFTTVISVSALFALPIWGPAGDDAPQGSDSSTPVAPEITLASEPVEPAPLPDNTWLNFLAELCSDVCYRDAHWMEPTNLTLGTGVWTAYRPFHVREGFVPMGEAALGAGFDVVLSITRRDGPALPPGVYPLNETVVDPTDYVSRGTTEYCGPGYASQDGMHECQWFVHDFPDGLPPGRYDIRAEWQAPCSAWIDLGFAEACADPNEMMSLFESFVNAPFFEDRSFDALQATESVVIGQAGVDQTSEGRDSRAVVAGSGSGRPDRELETDPATFEGEVAPRGDATPLTEGGITVDADTPRLALGERTALPDNAWMDFLAGFCWETCFRDAHIVDPNDDQMGFGRWAANLPFHIREGFVNGGDAPLGAGFEVVVYVTRRVGPQLDGGAYEIDQTYQFSSDYVLRGTANKCGPGYWEQTAPQACEWLVHDFSAGLPPGRYDIWAKWYAPCSAWMDLGLAASCEDPNEVTSMFASSVNMPFYGDGFTEGEEQPFDPYLYPESFTRGAPSG